MTLPEIESKLKCMEELLPDVSGHPKQLSIDIWTNGTWHQIEAEFDKTNGMTIVFGVRSLAGLNGNGLSRAEVLAAMGEMGRWRND